MLNPGSPGSVERKALRQRPRFCSRTSRNPPRASGSVQVHARDGAVSKPVPVEVSLACERQAVLPHPLEVGLSFGRQRRIADKTMRTQAIQRAIRSRLRGVVGSRPRKSVRSSRTAARKPAVYSRHRTSRRAGRPQRTAPASQSRSMAARNVFSRAAGFELSSKGSRGWWRSLCSNQATNCS